MVGPNAARVNILLSARLSTEADKAICPAKREFPRNPLSPLFEQVTPREEQMRFSLSQPCPTPVWDTQMIDVKEFTRTPRPILRVLKKTFFFGAEPLKNNDIDDLISMLH